MYISSPAGVQWGKPAMHPLDALLKLHHAIQFVGLLTRMSSDCIPPSQVSPMTRFRGKDTFSILTAHRHGPTCSGIAPDSLVQLNKNACPMLFIGSRICHKISRISETAGSRRGCVANAVVSSQFTAAPGLSIDRRIRLCQRFSRERRLAACSARRFRASCFFSDFFSR